MHSKSKIVVIHGTGGSPNINWFPWLKGELENGGHEVLVPTFPTPKGQSLETWKNIFDNQIGSIESNMILIGHSLGVGFILNLLEYSSRPVVAVGLVSGFVGRLGLPKYDSLNESFVCRDFNWNKIRQNFNCGFLFNSDNDPYVPLAKGEELAEKLLVPLTVVPGAGHINSESGYNSFPLLLEKMKSVLLNY